MAGTSSREVEPVVGLSDEERRALLELARVSIRFSLANGGARMPAPVDVPERLARPGACFVTLRRGDALRGCVGTLTATGSLAAEVTRAAHSAAFRDPRFEPVAADELDDLSVHISVLSEPVAMEFTSEPSLLAQLRPGIDGLVLRDRGQSGTFLPDVWQAIPEPRDFLRHLRLKAGLPADHWSETLVVERYVTEAFG